MRVALVGQPNSGKSAIFNAVAGYKAEVSNFPGTTLELVRSAVTCSEEHFDLVDVPGTYSLSSSSEEERRARDNLLALEADVIVDVVDASLLERSLELTFELLELGMPLVVCLNMMDEARRKGVAIDADHLARDLGVPVVGAVAVRGQGMTELFCAAVEVARTGATGTPHPMSRDVEDAVDALREAIGEEAAAKAGLPARFLAIKLLEQDSDVEQRLGGSPELLGEAGALRAQIERAHGRPADVVISSERHALSMNLFEHVATVSGRADRGLRDRLDRYVMHPFWGTAILFAVLAAFFCAVFGAGRVLETPILGLFERLSQLLASRLESQSLGLTIVLGVVQGFSGGIGIVLPYLVPFLVGLAILEDVGYIPRAAFLMDALMHRIGLHGKAVIPFVLGYGCTVPAIMGARIMESSRDRWVTAVLVNFVPCAARTTVVFALIGFALGPLAALGFYLLNIVVIAAAGRVLLWLRPEASPGLVLDIPPFRTPSPSAVAKKVWFRLREFVVLAWPILIVGSVALSLLDHFHLSDAINGALAPLTSWVLGLPPETGVTLVFGLLRKELTVVMLVQALGTSDFSSVMTPAQMAVYTAFTLFYVPCLATLATLRSVIGLRGMLFALAFTTAAATLIAAGLRLVLFAIA